MHSTMRYFKYMNCHMILNVTHVNQKYLINKNIKETLMYDNLTTV